MKTILLLSVLLALPVAAQTVWTLRSTPPNEGLYRPAGKPGLYLIPASGLYSAENLYPYLRSVDALQWQSVTLPGSRVAVVCYNGRFVGADECNGIWYSDDGLSATMSYVPTGSCISPNAIAFGNNTWLIAMGDGRVARSSDNAVTWQFIDTPAASIDNIVFGGGKFIGVADNGSVHSPDGLAWTIGATVPGAQLSYEAGRYVTLSHSSTNGTTWSPLTGSSILPVPQPYFLRTGNGRFLTWEYGAQPPKLYTATTGAWSSAITAPILDYLTDVAFCGDMWIAVSHGDRILTSPIPTMPAPVAPALNIAPALRLSWQSQTGRSYIIQRSVNNTAWTDNTGTMLGTGTVMEWLAPASASREFFRVQVR